MDGHSLSNKVTMPQMPGKEDKGDAVLTIHFIRGGTSRIGLFYNKIFKPGTHQPAAGTHLVS